MDSGLQPSPLRDYPELLSIFPYREIREPQLELMVAVRRAMGESTPLVAEGPTGMGKTVALLCGLLSSPELEGVKVVYCSRTHGQLDRVVEELRTLSSRLDAPGMSLRGRREMCLHPLLRRFTSGAGEAAHLCTVLRKEGRCQFFDRLERKGEELVSEFSGDQVTAGELLARCKEEGLCPYEISRGLMPEMRVVACSYLYLLDPSIRPPFLKGLGAGLPELAVVFDEAHNLPELAVELASERLVLGSLLQGEREASELEDGEAEEFCSVMEEVLGELSRGLREGEERVLEGGELEEEMRRRLGGAREAGEHLLEAGERMVLLRLREGRAPRSHLRAVGRFLLWVAETAGRKEFLRIVSVRGDGTPVLEVQALDPRFLTLPVFERARAVVCTSGTLSPLEAYADVVGLPSSLKLRCSSPFPPGNVLALVVRGVTTREQSRGPGMYRRMVKAILEVEAATPGNVGVFTASYEVLEGLLKEGLEEGLSKPLLVEERESSSEENDRKIREFKSCAERGGAVLLGVMGGRNAEGGDYPGHQMDSVVAVGIPYAPPSKRLERTVEYWEDQFPGLGRRYGYYLPAHRRLAQAAGRAHRLLSDRAAIVFLDERVFSPFVRGSLPGWMAERLRRVEEGELRRRLEEFFRSA
ncbi:MAG: helicase C-terminal domain-containing protein [Candidatus Hadarchaeales archaeon]